MARTRLFSIVRRVLGAEAARVGYSRATSTALSRRQMLRLAGAAAGVAALGPITGPLAFSPASARTPDTSGKRASIAIVGGGVAGLTAAYRLAAKGLRPAVFEASNRWGGRMFTRKGFYGGMFCELGGELVDTNHEDLSSLADELGLELQALAASDDVGDDLYYFGGKFYTPRDMIDPEKGTGAFAPIAAQIAQDSEKLLDEQENWTAHARALDATSLKDYLARFKGKAEDWAIALLDVAYLCEFGIDTAEQSALNLVDCIGTDLEQPFQIFGDSDESYRIKGGSSALIEALVKSLDKKADMALGTALTSMGVQDGTPGLTLKGPRGTQRRSFDMVILAMPFTTLREVDGLDAIGLSDEKLAAIRELGYGNNAKLMCGTTSRAWRSDAAGLPGASTGSFFTDLPFQSMWETSRAQPGSKGILTNYLAGAAADGNEADALSALRAGLNAMSAPLGASLDPKAVTSFFWNRHPFTLGSYAGARLGQYTTLLEVTAAPELDGRLQFAGEHTSSDFLGYMNGGVESGNRAAAAVAELAGAATASKN